MPRYGTTFDENNRPPMDKGELQGLASLSGTSLVPQEAKVVV
jgi:hypothetical protein